MNFPESLRSRSWRPVLGLMLAGLLGWLAAWFVLPNGPTGAGTTGGSPAPQARPAAPAGQASPSASADLTTGRALEQLSRSQSVVSEGAARSTPIPPIARNASSAAPPGAATKPSVTEAARVAKRQAMLELQASALAEIRAVPPGDTKKLMAALERFETRMRAAGAPSIIDMDKMRKTMEGLSRVQELNRQLIAETEKGRSADPTKIQSLGKDLVAAQREMPQQFIKTDVLQQQLVR